MISMLEDVLRRPKTVFVLMLALIAAGVMTYISIPKESDPDIDVPVFYVSIAQQGISPEDAERLLVRPMETELRGLDGLKEITAIASEGHAGIVLEFDISFNKDEALADVRDKVDQAKGELPEDAEEPTISETNFALVPVMWVSLSGNVPERTLYQHARRLKDLIEAVDTVRSADLSGHREEMLEVLIDTQKLEAYSITQAELFNTLTANNRLVPAGFLDGGTGRFNVKVPGLVETAADIYSLPIKQSGEGVVTLSDIAEIRRTFKDASAYTRVNGEPAIALQITKRIGTNIIENNNAVRAVVENASKDWPDSINVNIMLDSSSNIFEILGSLQSSILTAIFLVMILVLAALGLRSALLVGLAIPTSFMVGFLILGGIGYTVNIMVMFGLVLTVGLLVDGAIVMTEYADRKVQDGMEDREAYIRAAKLMFWPIVSSTATTLVAFLPMLLWPGVAGEFMSYLPIMVIIVLTASLVTAMVFIPVTGGVMALTTKWVQRNATWLLALVIAAAAAGITALATALPQTFSVIGLLATVAAFLVAGVGSFFVLRPFVRWRQRAAARKIEEEEARPVRVYKRATFVSFAFEIFAVILAVIFGLSLLEKTPALLTNSSTGLLNLINAAIGENGKQLPPIVGDIFTYFLIALTVAATIWALVVLFKPVVWLLETAFAWLGNKIASLLGRTQKAPAKDKAWHFNPLEVPGATGYYIRRLDLLARNPIGNLIAVGLLVVGCMSIVQAFMANPTGDEFFVDEEPDQAVVLVSGRGNISAAESLAIVQDVEKIVLNIEGIKNVVTVAKAPGGGGGGVALGGVQDKPGDVIGELQLELADFCCRREYKQIAADIRTLTASLPGIKVEPRKIEGGPPTGKDVQLELKSTNYDTLVENVARVRAHLDQMDGLMDQEDDRPLPGIEWRLDIDREQAARFQADIASVGNMVQLVTNGVMIGKYRPSDSEDEVDIRVRLPESQRSVDRFDQLRLQTPLGLVPLANFVDRSPAQKVSEIVRRDGLYSMMVKASVDPTTGATPTDKVKELQAWLDTQTWPENVFLQFRGADEDQKESGEFLMKAMIASLFLMFLILLTQYNSFYQTFLTLSTVVLSVFGVLLGMLLTGQKFSIIMTGTGVVALAGIVVNNAIVLIDTYNRFRGDGLEPLDAILKTASQRLRPILLTTVTTIAGLIPMATKINFDFFNQVTAYGGITAVWWVQLSTAVISGLAFSTFLTLIVVPVAIAMPSVWLRFFRAVWNWLQTHFQNQSSELAVVGAAVVMTEADIEEIAQVEEAIPEAAETTPAAQIRSETEDYSDTGAASETPAPEDVRETGGAERPSAEVVPMTKPAKPKEPPSSLPEAAE